jgi:peptidoglycan/xylan/chitin deacetylase (PgdA/CDA1 family)
MSGVVDTRPTLLVFHKLTPVFTFGVTNYPPQKLHKLIDTLTAAGWCFDCSANKCSKSVEGRGSLAISFDDGYEHLADHLPELMPRHNLQPLVFIPTDLEGQSNAWDYSHLFRPFKHLNRELIQRLSLHGVIFGSHGASHCDLTRCRGDALTRELSDSRKRLQDWTGQSVDSISYPFGRCNEHVRNAAEESGYLSGFTMQFPTPEDHALARGRVPVYSFDTSLSISAKLGSGLANQLERTKSAIVTRLSGGTVWLNRIRRNR